MQHSPIIQDKFYYTISEIRGLDCPRTLVKIEVKIHKIFTFYCNLFVVKMYVPDCVYLDAITRPT